MTSFPQATFDDPSGSKRNVYVASLPFDFDDYQLLKLFSPFGRISSARIMRAKKSHASKGYGFVLFKEARSAEMSIESLHGRFIGISRIQVRLANIDASFTFSKGVHMPSSASAGDALMTSTATSTDASSGAISTTTTSTLSSIGMLPSSNTVPQVIYAIPQLSGAPEVFQPTSTPPAFATMASTPQLTLQPNCGQFFNAASMLQPMSSSVDASVFAPGFVPPVPQPLYVMLLPSA